jgi:Fur family ferric uptake transcriptional regulator
MRLQLQNTWHGLKMKHMTRMTKQRNAIQSALLDAARPLLPQEILVSAQQQVPNLNLATVYRNLNLLSEEKAIAPVHLPGQPTRFELAGHHHHHFQCKQCDRVFDVHACSAEISKLAPKGFEVIDHDVILYGRCPDCRK